MSKRIENLVVDTTAFIKNAPLHEIGENIITVQDVVDEVLNKRQLRRLVVLPYDLKIVNVEPEYIQIITNFSKNTGDYPSLSATDIKVMALTYQLEKQHVGTSHLREKPVVPSLKLSKSSPAQKEIINDKMFILPAVVKETEDVPEELSKDLFASEEESASEDSDEESASEEDEINEIDNEAANEFKEEDKSDESNWITPNNIEAVKKSLDGQAEEVEAVKVACLTTDFAMQNVLKQIGLSVSALDGRVIKQLRTFVLRCHTCFKTTSVMDKVFCPKCGNRTLKKVAVSLNENGQLHLHINLRRPLTARGKKFSLPTFKGGKHSNNPIIVEDQPLPQQQVSRKFRAKNNPLDPDYLAGHSPFVARDVTSKAAYLGIRQGAEIKHWMKKNPNESRKRRK